jgi:hypothetical protein
VVIAGRPYAEFKKSKKDIEGQVELVPAFAERLGAARREARFAGMAVLMPVPEAAALYHSIAHDVAGLYDPWLPEFPRCGGRGVVLGRWDG